jgi:cobalt-zinc-cadmium resistance protein CzcA
MLGRSVVAALRRGRVALGLTALAAIVAVTVARRLELDALPDVTNNQVVVLTRAPGLTPLETEELVTRRVEAATGGLAGIDSTRSLSRYGISAVTLIFGDDVDPWGARQRVGERLATLAAELPAGVEAPEMGPLSGGLGEVYHLVLRSDRHDKAALLEMAELRLAPILRTVPGVVEVNTWGGAQRTHELRVRPSRLAAHGLTFEHVANAIRRGVGRTAGAALPVGDGQTLLGGRATPRSPEALAALPLQLHDRPRMPVGMLGDAAQGEQPRTGSATVDGGGEAVYIMAQMLRGANALDVCQRLERRLPELREALPAGASVEVLYDRAVLVRATLLTVGTNLVEGGLLVVAVLFAMLGSLRAGLLVAFVIPLSMLGALSTMVVLGVPGNLMSLGAIDFGLLVDGAVVVVEALFHDVHVDPSGPRTWRERVAGVARGASRPVFFSVFVIALVYAPIVALSGVDGRMFRPMALVVIAALLTSLVLALWVVPAACAAFIRPQDVPAAEPRTVRAARAMWRPVFRAAHARPRRVAAAAVTTLVLGGWLFVGLGSAFVPTLDEGDLVIQTERSPDISIEAAVVAAGRLERALLEEVPEVEHVVSRIGSPAVATDIMGLEQADVFVKLTPARRWAPERTRASVIEDVARVASERDPTAEIALTQPIQMRFNELLGGAVNDVTAEVFGLDLGAIRHSAEAVATAIEGVEGAVDVRVLTPADVPLVAVVPDAEAAARVGLDAADILQAVQALRVGVDVGRTFDGLVEVPLRLRLGSASLLGGPGDPVGVALPAAWIEQAQVVAPHGVVVPLSSVATIERRPTPSRISHDEGQRRVVVGFNVRGRDLGSVVADAQRAVERAVQLPPGQRLRWGGQHETLANARARMRVVLPVTLLLVLIVLVLGFGELRPALIVLSHVPFAAVGGAVALAVRGMPLSISALIGFIALSGIAVLNGVVLMSRVRTLEAGGAHGDTAVCSAAEERLRPVLTTALVAALGFVPMMLASGTGAEVQRPLATVVVGGLVTATAVTLIVLPTMYGALARWRTPGLPPEPR